MVDVRRGIVLAARDVVIRGTRIAAVQPSGGALPSAKTVIEGRGKCALPGLIDADVVLARHTRESAATLLADGITAVRAVGTDAATIAEWRRALAFGKIYAPRRARACDVQGTAAAPAASSGRTPGEPGCSALDPADASPLAALLRMRAPSFDAHDDTAAGSRLHDALELFGARGGGTPSAALRAVTLDSAALLALDDLGEIAVGKAADIIVTTASTLVDVRHLRAIDAVVCRGGPLTQAHLNLLRVGRLPRGTSAAPYAAGRAGHGAAVVPSRRGKTPDHGQPVVGRRPPLQHDHQRRRPVD